MKNNKFLFITSIMFLVISCQMDKEPKTFSEPVSMVNSFIGTGGHGHTYPGAVMPFGMVQLSPDNGTQGWDWCSGYHITDTIIAGFSHLHMSGTGIGDLYDISVLPFLEKDLIEGKPQSFSHSNEYAEPGYYTVTFNNGIKAELTASERGGFHRYSYPSGEKKTVALDLGFAINWDKPTAIEMETKSETRIVGMRKSVGWAKNQQVFFAMDFSESIQKIEYQENLLNDEAKEKVKTRAMISFSNNDKPLLVKVAISSVSIGNAIENLNQEPDIGSFDQVRNSGRSTWNAELGKISASFISPEMDTVFNTAMYHAYVAPSLYSDHDGSYFGADKQVRKAEGFNRYTVLSIWDTFRAAHPLYTITQKEKVTDFVKTMLAFYDEYGLLPVWELQGSETNTMTGYHAVPVLADAFLKGLTPDLGEEILTAMLASANQEVRGSNFYREYGFIPADKDGWSVTKTLEYAFDDWCIAQVAKKLGKDELYDSFMERSKYYRALYDPETKFMRGKNADGSWVEPFDPFHSEHGFEGIYIEGTAWQHSWFVPHDVEGMIELFGGADKMVAHLDETFSASSEIKGENASADISGLIGQYAHGNEPSHHIAYMYAVAGYPEKTQEKVRQIMREMYSNNPDGLSGNEDCGQMSAWYVFSALGFYPMNPADGKYVFGSPLVLEASIAVGAGKSFNISTENNSSDNIYIEEVLLNGQKIDRQYITHDEIMAGGNLLFKMTGGKEL